MRAFIVMLLSYLIGYFSSAYFLGKMSRNIDIRSYGSGNAGATNALRVLGKKIGALTFFLDFIKGIIAVFIGTAIFGFTGSLLAGILVVLGHNWPVFLGFKGGKGVATSFGVLLALNWQTALLCFLIGAIVIIVTKYVSLGSIIAAISAPIIIVLATQSIDKYLYITIVILALLSISRHKANILRLCKGEENKLGNNM